MSDNYAGCLKIFNEEGLAGSILTRIEKNNAFTANFSEPDWKPQALEIFILSFGDKAVHYIALATRGGKTATSERRLHFSHHISVHPPIEFGFIEAQLSEESQGIFKEVLSSEGKRIPNKTWKEIVNLIKNERPTIEDSFDKLEQMRKKGIPYFVGNKPEILAQEKDATYLALKMVGFDTDSIKESTNYHFTDMNENPPSFIAGLSSVEIREDDMIRHDMDTLFKDWQSIPYQIGAKIFTKGSKKITIINANRNKLEHTTGVDLIFYHENYRAFIMIQYKRMLWKNGEYIYRPDDSFRAELDRMKAIRALC
ncbi:MAG: hypothetical protein K8L91_12050 [Anaerolineae bacterium]|nr:hypothetical protein [Anaerolineae bacterium]